MKQYKSHKIVNAAGILIVDAINSVPAKDEDPRNFVSHITGFEVHLDTGEVVNVRPDTFARGNPSVGDYLVQYGDGYVSHSPKGVFEDGYTMYVPEQDEARCFSTPSANVRLQMLLAANRVGETTSQTLARADDFFKFVRGDEIKFEIVKDAEDVTASPLTTSARTAAVYDGAVYDALAQITELAEQAVKHMEDDKVISTGADTSLYSIVQTCADLKNYLGR